MITNFSTDKNLKIYLGKYLIYEDVNILSGVCDITHLILKEIANHYSILSSEVSPTWDFWEVDTDTSELWFTVIVEGSMIDCRILFDSI